MTHPSPLGRKGVPHSVTKVYCAAPDCDGEGFYSARCHSEGHPTAEVKYVAVEHLREARDLIAPVLATLPSGGRADMLRDARGLIATAIDGGSSAA
jgi:hypothetical protein